MREKEREGGERERERERAREGAVKLYNPGPQLMQLTCYSGLEEAQLLR